MDRRNASTFFARPNRGCIGARKAHDECDCVIPSIRQSQTKRDSTLTRSRIPGHRDAAGIYVGYANANVDVSGLVTNEAATGYVQRKTGSLNLDAWSGAAYWTHYGPGDWYLDAVAQATQYQGAASTQFAGLATTGFGVLTSPETGYPIRLPMFGPGFVLEPQAQIVWQRVSFDDANDGMGEVALGTTSG